ncbi:ParB N-terminal domain-containing protein [Burkholderia multivorans]|nr:ParB N-terminal domain-containing protein [Burkholderia multivorans]
MQQKSTSKLLKHTEIRREISLQTRAEINVSTVEEYKEALQGGAKFPPVVTFFDGIYYYLADGWHRYEAYVAARVEEIPADVYKGTRRDAQLYALVELPL